MAQRVQVCEEKDGVSPSAWLIPLLLPLLLVLAGLTYLLTRQHGAPATDAARVSQTASVTAAGTFPDLGTVHFDAKVATLTPGGQATLQRAAAVMKGNSNVYLRLKGNTDSTGEEPRNARLAYQRTKNVAEYLYEQGIERNRLTGAAFGASQAP